MTAIVKTSTTLHDVNLSDNDDTHIFISRKTNANNLWRDWKHKDEILWSEYEIDESDMRIKTAKITTPQYLDLTTGQYCVLITSKEHEDFGGVLLADEFEYNAKTELYTYQCQDFSRVYQGKFEAILKNIKLHRVLQHLITQGDYPLTGKVNKSTKKEYKKVLSGLRPAYQYDQEFYGSTFRFNPMTQNVTAIIRNQSWIEAIRNLVWGTGAYIDVYFDKYGLLHVKPYHKDDLFNSGLYLTTPEIMSAKYKFDTTNILTGVVVQSTNNTKVGKYYTSSSLFNLDLSVFFGNLNGMINNPNQSTANKTNKKSNSKKSSTATKTSNPYKTKKKTVWLNTDNIKGKSADRKFLEDIAKILRKNGWRTKIVGVGPNTHTEKYMGPKNGIWFCVYGGADAGVFREASGKTSYTNKLKKLGSRTVIGMHGGGDIRKGGKYYKWLPRAHDDNYSPSGFRGVSYPLKMLTKHKVPIMYASTAKQMAAKFLAGGDNPKAC